MLHKNKKINFLFYKNQASANNHKISSINFPKLKLDCDNKLKRNKSNFYYKINIPISQTLLLETKNSKKLTNKNLESNKKSSKTLSKNESIYYINENKLNKKENERNNSHNDIRKINHKLYYNYFCLGLNSKKKEINKTNFPLSKFFIYNIPQRNKRQKINIMTLNKSVNINNQNNNKDIKLFQPNYSLIEKELIQKYKDFRKNNIMPNILSHRFSPIIIKNKEEKQLKTDEESVENYSSENNQYNSFIEENILNQEKKEYKNENIKNNNNFNNCETRFHRINNIQKQKLELLRIKNKAHYKLNSVNKIKDIFKEFNSYKNTTLALKNLCNYFSKYHKPSYKSDKAI